MGQAAPDHSAAPGHSAALAACWSWEALGNCPVLQEKDTGPKHVAQCLGVDSLAAAKQCCKLTAGGRQRPALLLLCLQSVLGDEPLEGSEIIHPERSESLHNRHDNHT